jgi:hypothetical protein
MELKLILFPSMEIMGSILRSLRVELRKHFLMLIKKFSMEMSQFLLDVEEAFLLWNSSVRCTQKQTFF